MGCFWSDEKKYTDKISQLTETIESLNKRHDAAIKERERELERARNERLADQRKYQKRMDEITKEQEIERAKLSSEYEEKLAEKDRLLKEAQGDMDALRVEERQKLERLRSENNEFISSLTETYEKKLEGRDEMLRELREELALVTKESRDRAEEIIGELEKLIEALKMTSESDENGKFILHESLLRLSEFRAEMKEHHLKRIEVRERRESLFDIPVPKRRKSSGNVRFASLEGDIAPEVEETHFPVKDDVLMTTMTSCIDLSNIPSNSEYENVY